MPRLLLFFCSLFLFLSCQTEEEMIKDKAIETAHDWLQWKYDPLGSIDYADVLVVPVKNSYGEWSVSFSADIFCISRPFPQSRPDSVASISGKVFLDMVYHSNESRFVITNSILP